MPNEDLSLNLKESGVFIIDEAYKALYTQYLMKVVLDFKSITTEMRNNLQQIAIDNGKNVTFIRDARNVVEKMSLLLERSQEDLNKFKSNFLDIYQSWEQNCIKKLNDVIEIEDSSSDLEIINEIKYQKLPPSDNSNTKCNSNGTENNPTPRVTESSNVPLDKDHCESSHTLDVDITYPSNNNIVNESCKESTNLLVNLDLESSNNQKYERSNSKTNTDSNIHLSTPYENRKENLTQSDELQQQKKFSNLINLNLIENKRKKRRKNFSDSSTNDGNNSSVKNKKVKNKKRKLKKSAMDNEIRNYYEPSGSTDENENHTGDDRATTFNYYTDVSQENEDKIKNDLLESILDSSEDNIDDKDNTLERDEKDKKKIVKKSHSNLANTNTKKSKSEWLKDEILNFKLSKLGSNNKEKEYNASETTEELASTSHNTLGLIIDENQKSTREKLNQVPVQSNITTNNSSNDLNHSSVNDDPKILFPATLKNNTFDDQSLKQLSKSSGRRNIRPVLDDQQTAEDTQRAIRDEQNRLQRLAEHRQQLQNLTNLPRSKEENKLILDFDLETKTEVTVNKKLIRYLKPHQQEGVQFMWDSCFESIKQTKSTEGSGCILAHCMGLGKTFQVITLIHTLLVHEIIGMRTVMVLCPTNTILNWVDEFETWLRNVQYEKKVQIYELTHNKNMLSKLEKLKIWYENGGVLILSYEMFRSFTTHEKKLSPNQKKDRNFYLLNPGADLVVCDEGHLIKNESSLIAEKIQDIRTKRRIILTGTPLQNNLSEYHFMVQFVKPNLLGTKQEFQNRFINPITNGQFDNSTPGDVQLMKRRAYVLHGMLKGCVQRYDYTILKTFLPPKQEYVILIRLSELQMKMYKYYIDNIAKINAKNLFMNYHEIKRLVTHPKVLHLSMRKKAKQKDEDIWFFNYIKNEYLENIYISYKMILLFGILERCEKEGDKLLVFSQDLHTLDVIQEFLEKIDESKTNGSNNLFHFQGEWKKNHDYFRLDGSVNPDKRNVAIRTFNDISNKRARLFLISAKAGGLGINLTGANRVVVFDPCWNPSVDLQSIARIFRFGQKKPCYIYRFLAAGTLEEKIYNRQVTKLSLALRVVDEQQIGRHYKDTELAELYKFEPHVNENPTLSLPKDHVLADVFLKHKKCVYNFFEHDSLLKNKEDEVLNKEEQEHAWREYEEEKLRKRKRKRMPEKSSECTIPECPSPLFIESKDSSDSPSSSSNSLT